MLWTPPAGFSSQERFPVRAGPQLERSHVSYHLARPESVVEARGRPQCRPVPG